jgi:hypothetical protein
MFRKICNIIVQESTGRGFAGNGPGIRQDAIRDTENSCRYFAGRKARLATNQ